MNSTRCYWTLQHLGSYSDSGKTLDTFTKHLPLSTISYTSLIIVANVHYLDHPASWPRTTQNKMFASDLRVSASCCSSVVGMFLVCSLHFQSGIKFRSNITPKVRDDILKQRLHAGIQEALISNSIAPVVLKNPLFLYSMLVSTDLSALNMLKLDCHKPTNNLHFPCLHPFAHA